MLKHMIIALLLIAAPFIGCAGHKERPHGAKLSEAMEKASSEHTGDRKIETQQHTETHHHEPHSHASIPPDDVASPDMATSQTNESINSSPQHSQTVFTLSAGTGNMSDDNLDALKQLDLSIGFQEKDKHRFDIYLGYGWISPASSGILKSAIDGNAHLATVGLRYKAFFTPSHTLLGVYLTAGIAWDWLYWQYENEIEADGRPVDSDSLSGGELFVGAGLNVVQTKNVQIGVEAVPTFIWLPDYTDEGFENDFFDDNLVLKLRVSLSWLPTPRADVSNANDIQGNYK